MFFFPTIPQLASWRFLWVNGEVLVNIFLGLYSILQMAIWRFLWVNGKIFVNIFLFFQFAHQLYNRISATIFFSGLIRFYKWQVGVFCEWITVFFCNNQFESNSTIASWRFFVNELMAKYFPATFFFSSFYYFTNSKLAFFVNQQSFFFSLNPILQLASWRFFSSFY